MVRCDAIAVTPLGEYVAIVAGRMTYSLDRGELWWRDDVRIRANPVVVCLYAHICGTRIEPRHVARLPQWQRVWTLDSDTPTY